MTGRLKRVTTENQQLHIDTMARNAGVDLDRPAYEPSPTWTSAPEKVKATLEDVLKDVDDEQPSPGLTAAPAAGEMGSSGDEYLGDKLTSLAYERMGEPEPEPDYPLEVSQFYEQLRKVNPHLPSVDYVLTEPITLEIQADGFHSLTFSVIVKLPDLG